DTFLPSRNRHDDLEGRARSQLRLNGPVQQGFFRIIDQLAPVFTGNPNRKSIRVKRWPAHHGKNFPGVRIHRHDGAAFVAECLFGSNLQIDVDGELQLLAGLGWLLFERLSDLATVTIDEYLPRAILAHENVVVCELDP